MSFNLSQQLWTFPTVSGNVVKVGDVYIISRYPDPKYVGTSFAYPGFWIHKCGENKIFVPRYSDGAQFAPHLSTLRFEINNGVYNGLVYVVAGWFTRSCRTLARSFDGHTWDTILLDATWPFPFAITTGFSRAKGVFFENDVWMAYGTGGTYNAYDVPRMLRSQTRDASVWEPVTLPTISASVELDAVMRVVFCNNLYYASLRYYNSTTDQYENHVFASETGTTWLSMTSFAVNYPSDLDLVCCNDDTVIATVSVDVNVFFLIDVTRPLSQVDPIYSGKGSVNSICCGNTLYSFIKPPAGEGRFIQLVTFTNGVMRSTKTLPFTAVDNVKCVCNAIVISASNDIKAGIYVLRSGNFTSLLETTENPNYFWAIAETPSCCKTAPRITEQAEATCPGPGDSDTYYSLYAVNLTSPFSVRVYTWNLDTSTTFLNGSYEIRFGVDAWDCTVTFSEFEGNSINAIAAKATLDSVPPRLIGAVDCLYMKKLV